MIGVYLIKNKINGKCYIGASKDVKNRWKVHRRIYDSEGDKEYNKVLYQAFRKYGLENFEFQILTICDDRKTMYEKEKEYIKKYQTDIYGYNASPGGEAGSAKGHCAGERNGRAKLSEADVIKIRTAYANREYMRDIYEDYKKLITKSSFQSVWSGRTWAHIMPEVFSEENRLWHKTKGVGSPGGKHPNAKLTNEDVYNIRIAKKNGDSKEDVYRKFDKKISKVAFEQIWYDMTWKEAKIE